jgi:thiosulfate/3-mercaptopyruvate sulfurtransferase
MFDTLVACTDLAAHLDDARWIVFDCRHDLADVEAGRRAYTDAHIPGARFVHLDRDLSAPKTGTNGRHPLPGPAAFCARLAALGMSNDKQAVAYDASGGYYAARLWWMLRWIGHERAAVLDGGWDAWRAAQLPVTTRAPSITAGAFAGSAGDCAVDAGHVARAIGRADSTLIDARSPDRYRGENETLDPVGGHIPGALNRFFKNNLAPDGRFKPAGELRREYAKLLGSAPPAQVVHQCGSGVTACHNLLAMEIAGLHGSKLYAGSWSEWCSDPQRPVARGASS